jgi:hypothetical protein
MQGQLRVSVSAGLEELEVERYALQIKGHYAGADAIQEKLERLKELEEARMMTVRRACVTAVNGWILVHNSC